jgi:protein-tyrosine phosphatase
MEPMVSAVQPTDKPLSVLIVCLGNICRSPAGETILVQLAKEEGSPLEVESCGTGDWNLGYPPDPRMAQAARQRGFELRGVARGIREADFARFDYILAVDHEILKVLHLRAPSDELRSKIHLLTSFSTTYYDQSIPDPYHGSAADFDLALDMLEDACRGFLHHLAVR